MERKLVVLLLVLVGGLAFVAPGSAWATTGHTFADQFGGFGSGDGQFGEYDGSGANGVAVMSSTGEVVTADYGQGAPRVQFFNADGVFQSAFPVDPTNFGGFSSIAVDPTGFGAVYVATGAKGGTLSVDKYSVAGVFAYTLDASGSETSINRGTQLAVDPVDGTVYVAATHDDGRQVIDRFDGSTGAFIDYFDGSNGSPDGTPFCGPLTSLAVDGSHRVYVLDSCKVRVDQYGAGGVWGAMIDDGVNPGAPSAVATDPASDEVYVAEAGPVGLQITHFTAGGAAPIYTFDASNVGGVRGMAASGTGTVYTADATNPFVQRFTRFDGPTVVTAAIPSPTSEPREAVLEGTIDPEGVDSSYRFEYGTDLTYGSSTEESDPVGGSDPVAASALVTGLQPNQTYHYRIVGSNGSGSIVGNDQTFTTAPGPPVVVEPAFASAITPRSVRLHGTVNPSNSVALWRFEYGTTTAYGTSTPTTFSFGGADVAVFSDIAGLEPATTYHFRLVASDFFSSFPQAVGADQTFVTAPAAASGANEVTTKRATLTGTINPHGQETSYRFNYGTTAGYGANTPEVDAGDGDGNQQVSQQVSGLLPDTIYHVQVVATSDNGVIRYGADGLFRTAPAPSAKVISPIGVSTDSATLVGDLDTHGLSGSYRFDVSSLDSSYSSSTAERPVAGNDGNERVSVPIDGLPAGETFVVQLRVTSGDSTEVSDQVTFATASVPKMFPPRPGGTGVGLYGCAAPRLDSYNNKPKPGETITISGRDLGTGGTATLGDRSTIPADWTASGFELEIPDAASGTLGLTVNCGQRSNTIAITVFKKPSSRFSIANTAVNGAKATLSIKVAGPGKLTSLAAKAKPGQVTVTKARGAKLVVKLNRAGVQALRKSKTGRLKVPIRVRYLPAGGRAATKTVTVTFNQAAGR